jgi:hypothetical protein
MTYVNKILIRFNFEIFAYIHYNWCMEIWKHEQFWTEPNFILERLSYL